MTINVQSLDAEHHQWDNYVKGHPEATLYHLSGWKKIIEKTYNHKAYYLMAIKTPPLPDSFKPKTADSVRNDTNAKSSKCAVVSEPGLNISQNGCEPPPDSYESCDQSNNCKATKQQLPQGSSIVGILPLIHIGHFLFGNNLISIPFFDFGGILADGIEAENALLAEAIRLAREINADVIELRNIGPLRAPKRAGSTLEFTDDINSANAVNATTRTHKVRMLRELPATSEILMNSFKSKLRSQIRKPVKEGLTYKTGAKELLNDFYEVFIRNMRDLGSPVHSKQLMQSVLEMYPNSAKIIVVYQADKPLACTLVIGFADTLENPWASALRKYNRLAPNMLLYWAMLEYACENGFRYFDFGRSTPDEGTFKFKKQWGAEPVPMHWHYIHVGSKTNNELISDNKTYTTAANIWSRLPVSVTKFVGPRIRKYIGL